MADNYDFYAKELQDQAELNRQQLYRNFPDALDTRIRERERKRVLEKNKNSLLFQTYLNNQKLVKRHTGHVFTNRKRNSNRKNSSSTKSKGGRKRKSGRKTKKNGW